MASWWAFLSFMREYFIYYYASVVRNILKGLRIS